MERVFYFEKFFLVYILFFFTRVKKFHGTRSEALNVMFDVIERYMREIQKGKSVQKAITQEHLFFDSSSEI